MMTRTKPIRVLIVDDHEIVRDGLIAVLAETPDIELAGSAALGAEAVRLARSECPDVVIMDLVLPDIDGIEATRQILDANEDIHVLVLTSFGDDQRVRGAIEAGAIGYLLKDVRRADLVRAIEDAAAGKPALHPEVQRHLMQHAVAAPERSPLETLTTRERSVLRCLSLGYSNREIASILGLTEGTVRVYISAMLSKLGVADRTQAALLAVRHGIKAE